MLPYDNLTVEYPARSCFKKIGSTDVLQSSGVTFISNQVLPLPRRPTHST